MTEVATYASLEEAARALRDGAAILGGGTLLMRDVNAGDGPERLLRVTDPALRAVAAGGATVTLGAGVTMAQVLGEPQLDFLHGPARAVGGPQLRAMGTVAGNLFAPHPYGDVAAALLALGARVLLVGGGARPLDDLLRDRGRDRARGGEVVAAIEIPRPPAGAFGFRKAARVKPKGVSVLSVAVLAPRQGGRIRGARVAWCGMGPSPMRGAAAERALEGQPLDAAVIARAAQVAAEGLDPPTDALATAWYRREVAGVHLRRLLEEMEARR